ncbi:MAG: T9SS type A sorting domain-containing protein [Bacteroidia bacterium]|nr:T9SS type A sorting domain-containing protein [Bacteroidia bacterium]
MKKYLLLFLLIPLISFSQGLINNGAYIVMTNTSNIYIDGATGSYTNQSGGLISNATTGGIITLFGNWTNNAANVAFNNDGTTVNFSGANQTIGGTNSTTFFNVNLLGSGTKTLNVNTRVGGIATLTGVLSVGARILDLNSRTLTISNPAAGGITYGAGYILSETNAAANPSIVTWNMGTNTGAHVYPFGVAGIQIPFTFNKTTAGASNISVSTRATAANTNLPWAGASNVAAVNSMQALGPPYYADASIPSVVDRWWDITSSAAVTANLIFSYRGVENTTTAAPTGLLAAQHWNGTNWDPPVGSGTGVLAGVGTVSVTGASTFSPWVISTLILPLPIELMSFAGECLDDKTLLKWTTASETNNSFFTIEKSVDATNFIEIGTVTSLATNGNSNQVLNYSFEDNNSYNSLTYYRLKQTDLNGTYKTFNIVPVDACSKNNETVDIYNNGSNQLTIVVNATMDSNYKVDLYNSLGQIVYSQQLFAVEGFNKVELMIPEISNGVYFVSLNNGLSKVVSKKISLSIK